ncbi:MAG: glycosyltransferase family 2 protein [Verrucomicrobia bacterium]|nr:glycosyltransferase family 2 protein [Verrucomicrobiota bacterium]
MTNFKFSVFTAVYNHAKLLPQAIDSILQQTRLPDEYVIVDDGSTDESWDVVSYFASKHSFIRGIRLKENQGLMAALDIWLNSVTGDYCYAVAADDRLHSEMGRKSYEAAIRYPGAGIHFGSVWELPNDGVIQTANHQDFEPWTELTFLSPEQFMSDYLLKAPIQYSPSAATVYRMDALREVGGFRPELGAWTDTFAIQAIGLKHGACFLPETGSYFRMSPNGFSQTQLRNSRLFLNIVERAASLMRSPEFREVFPAEYVVRWEKLYRECVVAGILKHVSKRYNEAGREYCAAFPELPPQLARLLMKFSGLFRQLQLYCLRQTLNAYRGDSPGDLPSNHKLNTPSS